MRWKHRDDAVRCPIVGFTRAEIAALSDHDRADLAAALAEFATAADRSPGGSSDAPPYGESSANAPSSAQARAPDPSARMRQWGSSADPGTSPGEPSSLAEPLRRRSRRLAVFALGCAVVLVAWVIDLGLNLPSDVTVRQWRLAWVGFDIGELAAFAMTGWAAWRARRWMIPATLITGTLLLCDAWFDVVLSWGTNERWQSLITAALVEVPLALLMWWVARRLLVAFLPPRLGSAWRRPARLAQSGPAPE